MGRVYQRTKGGPWYAYYLDADGKQQWRSLGTKDKAVAKERLRAAELASSTPRKKSHRLSEAISYLLTTLHDKAAGTREMYEQKGRRLIATMGDPEVSAITRDMIATYITTRLDKSDTPRGKEHGHAAHHTVKKELITLKRALQEALDRGVLRTMPVLPKFSAQYKPRETWLTVEQFDTLLTHVAPQRHMWASLAALAGANLSEVEGIDWATVELEKGWMLIPGTKRRSRHRRVPIAPALLHRLRAVPVAERHGRVAQPWTNVGRDLPRACKRAGVPRCTPNDLRRTFASWLVQIGTPLLTIAQLMGHSSTRMLELVYGKLSAENLETAVNAMPTSRSLAIEQPKETRVELVARVLAARGVDCPQDHAEAIAAALGFEIGT